MTTKILVGTTEGIESAIFYDSVTETAFGLLMNDLEEAESFQEYVSVDLRSLTHEEFSDLLFIFRRERERE